MIMPRPSAGPLSCRQCLFRRHITARQPVAEAALPYRLQSRTLKTSSLAAAAEPSSFSASPEDYTLSRPPIRQYLRQWQSRHGNHPAPSAAVPVDANFTAEVANALVRTQGTGSAELDAFFSSTTADDAAGRENHETMDIDAASVENSTRSLGDLVELRSRGSRTPIMAVYLGFIGGLHHFFGSNGRWITSKSFTSRFSISRFAALDDITPVTKKIPSNATAEKLEELRDQDLGPVTSDGLSLLKKMQAFMAESQQVYQSNISRLDKAQVLLSGVHNSKFLSLFEIAELIVPVAKQGEEFSAAALYAVHLALCRYEVGFHAMSPSLDCHRRDHIYEILSQSQMSSMQKVGLMVRAHCNEKTTRRDTLSHSDGKDTPLGPFLLKARRIVQSRRASKDSSTPPDPATAGESLAEPSQSPWSTEEKALLEFLEQWVAHDIFLETSRYHAYGSMILRFLDLYGGAVLNQQTAWTFLQEVGWIKPWEIPSRYKIRLPGTRIIRGGGLHRREPDKLSKSMSKDRADGWRRDWGQSPVFCIDGRSTVVIDDGVSLERTDKDGEYWIHVHAADPASVIQPYSELGEYLELIPESIYLPGHFQAMMPSSLGEGESGDYASDSLVKKFSLRPGSPTLTFSARVNENGDILDQKIEPGTMHNALYLEPEDVSAFCNEPPPPLPSQSHRWLEVGERPREKPLNRDITLARDLDDASKSDLQILSRLSQALHKQRMAKGAWPYFFPRPSVSVTLPDQGPSASREPYIKVSQDGFPGSALVTNCMILAGQVAARWCASRGVPLPYRKNTQPEGSFDSALRYAQTRMYPLIEKGIEPSPAQRAQLTQYTGAVDLSTTPGPYFLMGIDMYAKATSPLRRFGDLIVHWQIHAALAFERRNGRPLDPAEDQINSVVPFSAKALPGILALLQTREKMCKVLSGGAQEWILMALYRAWKVEKKLPETMHFVVSTKWRSVLVGNLDVFGLSATLDLEDVDNLVLMKNIHAGDQFEVELKDINTVNRRIAVKALRYVPRDGSSLSDTADDSLLDSDAETSMAPGLGDVQQSTAR